MKSVVRMKILLTIVICLIIIGNYPNDFSENNNNKYNYEDLKNPKKLRSGGFWDLTGTPIYINENDVGVNDWATINATSGWCTGSGTQGDPYIIENVIIDGLNSSNCIEIEYSSVYFIIRNCTLYNSGDWDAGMYLNYVDNAKIVNNTLRNNYDGIFFQGDGDYNSVSYNRIRSNTHEGIRFESFNNYCNITNNIVINNQKLGIILRQDCTNNIISENIVINNTNIGIQLQGGSNNNTVQGNTVKDSTWYGINVQGVENNRIKRNKISNNDYHGIVIHESNNNTIMENNIDNNSISGIEFETTFVNFAEYNKIVRNNITNNNVLGINIDTYSKNNTIFQNNFRNNFKHGWDDGSNNTWDDSVIGNYWDDYVGVDNNDDGIGDTAYTDIGGSAGTQDNYPIWWDPPAFTIISPSTSEWFRDIAPNYTISIDGGLVDTMWYTLDNGLINHTFVDLTGTINQSLWNNTMIGIIIIKFYINDTQGLIGYREVSIEKMRVELYWSLDPFVIDDNGGGDYTWVQAASQGWCSGSGTLIDPYTINLLKIDGENSSSCLVIRDSNIPFIISNSSFSNSSGGQQDAGIKLENVYNGLIIDNDCSNNSGNGIALISCQYIIITKNSINSNNISGIWLYNSHNNSIIDNKETINNNTIYGILLLLSDYNNITGNTIQANQYGIYLQEANYNTILNNIFHFNGIPVYIVSGFGNIVPDFPLPGEPFEFPFEILLIILIASVIVVIAVASAIILKKKASKRDIRGKKEISEKKKEKVQRKLEEKLKFVDYLIKESNFKLAYKNLGNVKDNADKYELMAIFNQAVKKTKYCQEVEAGISKAVISEDLTKPIKEKKVKEKKKTIPVEKIEVKEEVVITPVIKKEGESNYKLFISYSTLDRDYFQIENIVKELKKYPYITQVSYWERDSKANIVEFMEETLEVSNIFVLFCSENTNKSKAVRDEWQAAYQMRKEDLIKIIPVYEEQNHIPKVLWHLLNVKYDKSDFNGFIENLYNEIKRE